MPEALIAFVEDMDLCWIERRFDDLNAYLCADVVMVAPGGQQRADGRDAAIAEYHWDMARSEQGTEHAAKGREILVLAHADPGLIRPIVQSSVIH